MADLERAAPLPERIRGPVRSTLSGLPVVWPPLTGGEVRVLIAHGVAPLIYSIAQVPELRDHAIAAAAVEPLRLIDLRKVLEILAEAGVPAVILKGTALAYDLYESAELRPRGDTDLLVPAESFAAASEALRSHGLANRLTSGDEHAVRQSSFWRGDRFGATHVYDVHWNVINSPRFAHIVRQEGTGRRPLPKIGESAFGLPLAQALMLACLHRVVHHRDDERLIWLVDIALLRRAMSHEDHAQFWGMAAEHGVISICRRSVELAEEWLGESGPGVEHFLTGVELARREPSEEFLDPGLTYGHVVVGDLLSLSWRERLTRLRQLAFPSAAFMRESFPHARRAALPWLYVYRAGRGVLRLFRRARG